MSEIQSAPVEVPAPPTVSEGVRSIVNALTGEMSGPKPEPRTPKDRVVFHDAALAQEFFELAKPGTPEYMELLFKIKRSRFATGDFEQDVRNYLRLKNSVKSLMYLLGDEDE